MTPVIRIDDEVMNALKKRAIDLGLVFEPPNATLRIILGLDGKISFKETPNANIIELQLNKIYTSRRCALITLPKDKRGFFPGFKVDFEIITDVGAIITHVTSDIKGTPIGDPMGGKYIQGRLRLWYDKHPELEDGTKLRIEALEPGKRYKLSII